MSNKVIVSIYEGSPTINASPQGIEVEVRDHDTLDNTSDVLFMHSDEDNQISGKQVQLNFGQNSFAEFEKINYTIAPMTINKDEIEKYLGREIKDEVELKQIREYLSQELKQVVEEKIKNYK